MRTGRRLLGSWLLALLVGASMRARADGVDDILRGMLRDLHVPGASLAVVRDGRLVTTRSSGFANLELMRPVTADTVFEIGSLTKQFTAAAVLMLVAHIPSRSGSPRSITDSDGSSTRSTEGA